MYFFYGFTLLFLLTIGICEEIKIIKAPYHVQIESNKKYLCSGTIVDYKWLVTTATCVNSALRIKDIQVRSGTGLLTENGGLHSIIEVHNHPQWDAHKSTTAHNVALLQLRYHFLLSCTVFPMRIPSTLATPGDNAYYTTWQKKVAAGSQLNMFNSSVFDWNKCSTYFGNLAADNACLSPSESNCVGEGDPVLIDGRIQGFVQSTNCASTKLPIVLTDLSAYSGWMKETIKNNTKHNKGEQPPKKDPCPIRFFNLLKKK